MNLKVVEKCCEGLNCSAIFEDVGGDSFVVQGIRLAKNDRSSLSIGDHEDAVVIPRQLLLDLVARLPAVSKR